MVNCFIRATVAAFCVLAGATGLLAKDCGRIQAPAERLSCYDNEGSLQNSLQQMIGLELRFAQNGSEACGFVIDADRFKMRLVAADLTWNAVFGSDIYSREDLRKIGDDAEASRGAKPDGAYCTKAWSEYGTEAELPDNVLYRCRSKAACSTR